MSISYSSSLPQFSQPTKPLISPMNGSNKNSTGSNNRQISLPPISSIIKQDSYPQSFPYYSPPPFNDAPYNHQLPHPQSQYPALTVPPPSTQHRVALPFEMPAFEGYQHSYNMSNDYHYNLQKPPLIRKASPLNHQLNPIVSPSTTAYSSPVNNTFSSINPQQTHSAPTSATSAPAGGFPPKHPEFNKTTIVKKSSPTPKKSPSNDKVFAFISHSPATFPSQEPSIDNAQLARRKRRRTSSHELSILQNEFELGSNPNRNRRQEIAVKVKMDEKAVQIWFQNKRQSLKRCKLKKSNKEKAANTSIPEVSAEEEDEEEVNSCKVLDTSKETTPLKTKETSNSPSSTPSKSATISRKNSFDELSSNQTTISKDFSQSSISHPTTPNKAT